MSRKSVHKRTSCTVKKVHYDFLSVLRHCVSLQQLDPLANISVYKCDYCEGMHITRGGNATEAKMRRVLANNMKLMRDINWWLNCPPEVQSKRIDLEIEAIRRLQSIQDQKEP